MNRTTSIATFALIRNSEGKVLIIRRSLSDTFPGRWELPGGGMDTGERPEESIEREVYEETGLTVKAVRPFSVITHDNHDKTSDIVRITYECRLIGNSNVALTHDHDEYRWIDFKDLHMVDEEDQESPLRYIIKDILDNELYFNNLESNN